jgi:iron complex outermembrane receptor protein
MTTVLARRRIRGDHRFLNAYIEDTVRFIRTLDVSGGLVIERWQHLGGGNTIAYGLDLPMETDVPVASHVLVSPSLGALQRIDDRVEVSVRTSRNLRAPTIGELYRSTWTGDRSTTANPGLRPETVTTTEAGPEIMAGRFTARAMMFHSTIDHSIAVVDGRWDNVGRARVVGVDTEAIWRPSRTWLATMSYTFARTRVTDGVASSHQTDPVDLVGKELALSPRHRGVVALTYDRHNLATLKGALRLVGGGFEDARNADLLATHALVDALAVRKLAGGLSGFAGVDNLLDRRYAITRIGADVLGAPRTFHVGLRLDSARF